MVKKTTKRQGFTLVELLVTIILLGVIGAIVIYNMTSVSTSSKETEYERYVASVKSAASVYSELNPDAFNDLYESKSYIYITVEDLIQDGLLDEDLVNPYTAEKIGLDELVKANLDSTNGAVVFEYPIVDKKDETFLVAMSDYVVWGEPYDCMQGAGSYQLALSEENGDLIILNETTMKEYNFECKMPESFEYYNQNGVSGMRTTNAGNYEVTYSWVTKSGTRKSATRTLRVLAKVKPSFKTNYSYDFKNPDFFETEYDAKNKEWKYLEYTPYVEGADKDTTTYRITKKSNLIQNAPIVNVTDGFVNTYQPLMVDDGDKTYYIETVVTGHYNKNYSYSAKGEAVMKAELVVPEAYITYEDIIGWETGREYTIKNKVGNKTIHSPVEIAKFEYRFSAKDLDKNTETIPANLFNKKNDANTTKTVTVLGEDNAVCNGKAINYDYVYFRAINKEGYVGKWTKVKAEVTNNLSKVINTEKIGCKSSTECCLKKGNSCFYTDKVRYVQFGKSRFIILEKYEDGSFLATLDGLSENTVIPTQVKKGNAKEVTCDITVYKSFNYSSPVLQNIIDAGQVLLSSLPNKYYKYLELNKWSASTAKVVEYAGESEQWTPDEDDEEDYYEKTYYKVEVDKSYTYSAYVGNVTTSMIAKYGDALAANRPYWTNDTYTSEFTVYLDEPAPHCNESTTAYNVYFYYVSGKNTIKQTYVGQSAYVKPVVKFKNVNICSGQGTAKSPYIIGYKD